MAIGIISLSRGPTSNLITQVARSIGLSHFNSFSKFNHVFTIPIILSKAITFFTGETDIIIELPIVQTMIQILVPVGMLIRKNEAAARMERPMRIASTLSFLLVMFANKDLIVEEVGLAHYY